MSRDKTPLALKLQQSGRASTQLKLLYISDDIKLEIDRTLTYYKIQKESAIPPPGQPNLRDQRGRDMSMERCTHLPDSMARNGKIQQVLAKLGVSGLQVSKQF